MVEEDKQLAEECNKLKVQLEKERADHQNAKQVLVKFKERLSTSTDQLKTLEGTMKELETQNKHGQAKSDA